MLELTLFHMNGTVLWDNHRSVCTNNAYYAVMPRFGVTNAVILQNQEYVFVSFCTV